MQDKTLQFRQEVKKCIGKPITKVVAGGSVGSILTLDVGDRVAVLFIYCSWRLEKDRQILTGSNESSETETGQIPIYLQRLQGQTITDLLVSDFYDLRLILSNGYSLSIFCDITPHYPSQDYDENWSVCFPKDNLCTVVTKDFILKEELYSSD